MLQLYEELRGLGYDGGYDAPRHSLRKIRQVVNDALVSLDADFETLYTDFGTPSIPPERLIQAGLVQILFSVRSERQFMEQMDYNLLFRWFVGLEIDDPVWVDDGHVAKGDGSDPGASRGRAAAVGRAFLGRWNAHQGLGIDKEFPAEGRGDPASR